MEVTRTESISIGVTLESVAFGSVGAGESTSEPFGAGESEAEGPGCVRSAPFGAVTSEAAGTDGSWGRKKSAGAALALVFGVRVLIGLEFLFLRSWKLGVTSDTGR